MEKYYCKDCKKQIKFTKTSHQGFNAVTYRAQCNCHNTGELRSVNVCDAISSNWIDKKTVK